MTFEGERVLVTGGAGFIGSHLVERLVDEGANVVVLDNFSTGRRENLQTVKDRIRIVDGDIRDLDAVADAMAGVEFVFHEAALASVPESIEQPKLYFEVNVTGTLNVLEVARSSGVKRVVFASSSAVYGDSPESPKREDMLPTPLSPYAHTKLVGEQTCSLYSRTYGIDTVILRYFNVYGPRQDPDSAYAAVTPKFIHALSSGERPVIYGDGEQSRSFIYVADVVQANMLAGLVPGASGGVMNISTNNAVTVNEALHFVADALGVEAVADHADPRPGDVRESRADVERARKVLDFTAHTRYKEGVEATVRVSRVAQASRY